MISRMALSVLHRVLWIADAEEELQRILDHPEDGVLHVDDFLVAGQDQTLVRHVLGREIAVRIDGGAEADLNPVDPLHLRRLDLADGCGQIVVKAGVGELPDAPEDEGHALLVGLDPVEAGGEPECQADERDEGEAPAAAEPARQQALHAVLALAQDIFQVGRLAAAAPGPLPAAPGTAASARIAPGHRTDPYLSVLVASP
jgi:hypothetical protein